MTFGYDFFSKRSSGATLSRSVPKSHQATESNTTLQSCVGTGHMLSRTRLARKRIRVQISDLMIDQATPGGIAKAEGLHAEIPR